MISFRAEMGTYKASLDIMPESENMLEKSMSDIKSTESSTKGPQLIKFRVV